MPDQSKLPSTLRTVDDEFRVVDFFQSFDRNQFGSVFRFLAWRKGDVLCRAIRIGTIERRKSKTIFCDGGFQFLPVSSVINAYDTIPSRCPGSAIHPRECLDMLRCQDCRNEVYIFCFADQSRAFSDCSFRRTAR